MFDETKLARPVVRGTVSICQRCPLRQGCVEMCGLLRKDLTRLDPEFMEVRLSPAAEERLTHDGPDAEGLEEHERRVLIAEAMAELSPKQQEAVRLAVTRQFQVAELAKALGTTEKTAQNHIERACQRLSTYLKRRITPGDLWGQDPMSDDGVWSSPPYIVGGESEGSAPSSAGKNSTHLREGKESSVTCTAEAAPR